MKKKKNKPLLQCKGLLWSSSEISFMNSELHRFHVQKNNGKRELKSPVTRRQLKCHTFAVHCCFQQEQHSLHLPGNTGTHSECSRSLLRAGTNLAHKTQFSLQPCSTQGTLFPCFRCLIEVSSYTLI